jgi:hypothetical protein
MHPEAVLLVDDDQPQFRKVHMLLKQRMGAHYDVCLAAGHELQLGVALAPLDLAAEPADAQAEGLQPAREIQIMLLGQQLGRRHHGGLKAALHSLQRSQGSDQRLARAHVALQQAQHRTAAAQVGQNLPCHAPLCSRWFERQRCQEGGAQRTLSVEHRSAQLICLFAQAPQTQPMAEQLFECESALRGVLSCGQAVQSRMQNATDRRPVQEQQGFTEGGEAQLSAQWLGNPVGECHVESVSRVRAWSTRLRSRACCRPSVTGYTGVRRDSSGAATSLLSTWYSGW